MLSAYDQRIQLGDFCCASGCQRAAGGVSGANPCSKVCYGLGLMGDPVSPWGVIWGHNGGGPGYSTSAFHAPELGHISVCAMGAEEGFGAEEVVFAVFDVFLSAGGGAA